MTASNPHIQSLKRAGFRLTKARLTVLSVLEAEQGHITSADVLRRVERIDPAIGRASVFRSLDLFTQLGIIRPTYFVSSLTPTYVLMEGGHHHHVVCTGCKRFFEIENCNLDLLTRRLERSLSIKISGHLLEFFGLCQSCQPGAPADGKGAQS